MKVFSQKCALFCLLSFTFAITSWALLPPPVNQVDCNAISEANIGGSVDINLTGQDVDDYTVIYDDTTYSGLPAGVFSLPNIVGDVSNVTINANGMDNGNPAADSIACTLNFAAATCVASQSPDSTVTPVDVGTVITLSLETTNASTATVNGIAMTPSADPDTNNMVTFTASYVALEDEVVTAMVTNPDGETTTCTWTIDVNCIPPSLTDVAPVGQLGVEISGSLGCTYSVFLLDLRSGTETVYDVTVDTSDGQGFGTGILQIVVPPDTEITVGFTGQPNPGGGFITVPTLGFWGLIVFIAVLLAVALGMQRKRRLA